MLNHGQEKSKWLPRQSTYSPIRQFQIQHFIPLDNFELDIFRLIFSDTRHFRTRHVIPVSGCLPLLCFSHLMLSKKWLSKKWVCRIKCWQKMTMSYFACWKNECLKNDCWKILCRKNDPASFLLKVGSKKAIFNQSADVFFVLQKAKCNNAKQKIPTQKDCRLCVKGVNTHTTVRTHTYTHRDR